MTVVIGQLHETASELGRELERLIEAVEGVCVWEGEAKESEEELRGGECAHTAVLEPSVLKGVKGGAEERAAAVLKRWEGVRPQEQKGLYAKGAPAADVQLGAREGRLRVVPAKRGGRKGRGH